MKRCGVIICSLILCGTLAGNPMGPQKRKKVEGLSDEVSQLLGNWTGESICVDRERFPACHDEQVIYRIAKSPGHPQTVIITMDKIVNGKPETMAVLDFKYDPKTRTLVNEFTRNGRSGRWEFTINLDSIEGGLITLPEKIPARHVIVKKEK